MEMLGSITQPIKVLRWLGIALFLFAASIASGQEQLTIETRLLPDGTVGTAYSQTLSASGGITPYVWEVDALPPGLSLNSETGEISGTPTTADTFVFTALVTDARNDAVKQPVTIRVLEESLAITTSSLPGGVVGTAYSRALQATGGTGDYRWEDDGSLPPGLTLSATGGISGTPTRTGTFSFKVQVQDEAGATDSRTFSISILPAPIAISTSSLPDGTVGTAYSQTLAATGGTTPYSWSVIEGSLPAGLTLISTGLISGTPTRTGPFPFLVQVKDEAQATDSRNFSISILSPPLTITTSSPLPDGTVGTAYSQTLRASGGTSPYLWAVDALPSGLRLNSETGEISGTPTTAETFVFTALVTDAAGDGVKQGFTITILAAALEIISSALAESIVGTAYSDTLQARGGAPPYSWTVTDGSLPPRLLLDSSTGKIGGIPTTTGVFRFTVQVVDSQRATASKALSITVTSPLLITNDTTLPGGTVGVNYSEALIATGGTGTYEWLQLSEMPPGLRFDEATGVILGTPIEAGLFKFLVQVASGSEQVEGTFFIEFASSGSRTASLAITSEALLPIGILQAAYQQALVAEGGRLPYRWSVIEGPLPRGLALDAATGELAGTPATEGEFKFAVQVTDADLASATKTFFLQIASPNLSITTGAALPSGVVRVPYFLQLTASGGVWELRLAVCGRCAAARPRVGRFRCHQRRAHLFWKLQLSGEDG